MDSRRFVIATGPIEGLFQIDEIEAEDVVVSEGFVIFIRVNGEEETTETVAMFNQNWVKSVKEVKKND